MHQKYVTRLLVFDTFHSCGWVKTFLNMRQVTIVLVHRAWDDTCIYGSENLIPQSRKVDKKLIASNHSTVK